MPRPSVMLSFRVPPELAEELRAAAKLEGSTVAGMIRRGADRILEYSRARRIDEAHERGELEVIPGSGHQGPRRKKLDAVFGVRLSSEQIHAIAGASNARNISISAYLREAALAYAETHTAGGHVSCPHMSTGPVTAAECGQCGPLPVMYRVPAC